jgi:hypothetical protein
MTQGRNFFGTDSGIQIAAFTLAGVSDQAGFCAGRFLKHRAFIINTVRAPVLGFAGPVITALIMTHHPLAVDLLGTGVPFRPVMLLVFHRAKALGAVHHMVDAVAGVSPVIGVISAGGFPGVVFVDLTAAFGTGHPVAQFLVFGVGGAFRAGGVGAVVKGGAAFHGADTLVGLLRCGGPGAPDMFMRFFARVGAVEVNRDLLARNFLPIVIGSDNEVLVFPIQQEPQAVLDLAVAV